MPRISDGDGGVLTVDEIVSETATEAIVKINNRTYRLEKSGDEPMDKRWAAYEELGLDPADVAKLLAELQAHRVAQRDQETRKQKQPKREVYENDAGISAIAAALRGQRAVLGGDSVGLVDRTGGLITKAMSDDADDN